MNDKTLIDFLEAIDAVLVAHAARDERLDLYLLGRASLIIRCQSDMMTKDVDVIEVPGSPLLSRASQLFGKGSANAGRWGFYLETVSSGLPPMPQGFQSRASDLDGRWVVLRPKTLDPHDFAVSKLGRFHPRDRVDLQLLCDRGELEAEILADRLRLAFCWAEDGDPRWENARANLARVADYLEGRSRTL